jgi:hypothetical protein
LVRVRIERVVNGSGSATEVMSAAEGHGNHFAHRLFLCAASVGPIWRATKTRRQCFQTHCCLSGIQGGSSRFFCPIVRAIASQSGVHTSPHSRRQRTGFRAFSGRGPWRWRRRIREAQERRNSARERSKRVLVRGRRDVWSRVCIEGCGASRRCALARNRKEQARPFVAAAAALGKPAEVLPHPCRADPLPDP